MEKNAVGYNTGLKTPFTTDGVLLCIVAQNLIEKSLRLVAVKHFRKVPNNDFAVPAKRWHSISESCLRSSSLVISSSGKYRFRPSRECSGNTSSSLGSPRWSATARWRTQRSRSWSPWPCSSWQFALPKIRTIKSPGSSYKFCGYQGGTTILPVVALRNSLKFC